MKTRNEKLRKLGKLGHHLILSGISEVSEISKVFEFSYSPRGSFKYMGWTHSLSKCISGEYMDTLKI